MNEQNRLLLVKEERQHLSAGMQAFGAQLLLAVVVCTTRVTLSSITQGRIKMNKIPADRIGSPCSSSLECLLRINHSQCAGGTCACLPHHAPYNNTLCLPASLLGYACLTSAQCRLKVRNSECSGGLCACARGHLPLRKDKCLPPANVGDYCLNDAQCHLADKLSRCKYIVPRVYGKCECPLAAVNGTCVPRVGDRCASDAECRLASAFCEPASFECRCPAGLRPSESGLQCVRDKYGALVEHTAVGAVSLGKPCLHSGQCQVRDPHTHCVQGRCECVRDTPHCSAAHTRCPNDTFQCASSGQCISWYFVCDGVRNCGDGSDEDACTPFACPREAFQCVDGTCLSRSAVCNGRWECPDGSDEATCYTGIPCLKGSFRCSDGQCLPPYAFCNAIPECADGSDEDPTQCETGGEECPEGSFRCRNGRCRSTAVVCSGLDGCGDNSDEHGCSVCHCAAP